MATSAIPFYQTPNTRRSLASIFQSVEELSQNFRLQAKFIYEKTTFRKDKKRNLERLLNIIKTYSVCEKQGYLGVAFVSVQTIMNTYLRRYKTTISERTVRYALKFFDEHNFLDRIETVRISDNRQSTNIYRIKKFEESPGQNTGQKPSVNTDSKKAATKGREEGCSQEFAPKGQKNLHPKKAHFLLKAPFKIIKRLQERSTKFLLSDSNPIQELLKNPAGKLLNFVPVRFKELFSAITSSSKEIYEYWKITKYSCETQNFLTKEQTLKACETAFTDFYQSIKAASRGKFVMRNPFGFYYSVIMSHAGGERRRHAKNGKYNPLQSFLEEPSNE